MILVNVSTRDMQRMELAMRIGNNSSLFITAVAFCCLFYDFVDAADLPLGRSRPSSLYDSCTGIVGYEPPPCSHSAINSIGESSIECSAPAPYSFSAANGMGCAGILSNIKLGMARVVYKGTLRTQFQLTYNLYTGNGFQKDTDGFHVDAYLSDGTIARDILTPDGDNAVSTGGIQFDLQQCHYGSGLNVRVPPYGTFFSLTSFSAVNSVENLYIRVDPAINVGRSLHC